MKRLVFGIGVWGEIKEGVGETVIRMPNKIINETLDDALVTPGIQGKAITARRNGGQETS